MPLSNNPKSYSNKATSAEIFKAIERAFSNYIPPNADVFVAVSGGLDSTVLLHALGLLRPSIKQKISVVHINHQLRGKESEGDAAFVKKLAKNYGFPFVLKKIEWESLGELKKSQEGFRKLRLDFFSSLCRKPENRILLAHHQDDQVETFLLRLIRGTGLRGLQCMQEKAGPLVRPLLPISKANLKKFAVAEGISWREDSSNTSNKYERNWVRKELMPVLEARRSGFAKRTMGLIGEIQSLKKKDTAIDKSTFHEVSPGILYAHTKGINPEALFVLPALHGCTRAQRKAVLDLIKKGTGKLQIERRELECSCGFLMITSRNQKQEKNKPISPSVKITPKKIESSLGQWILPSQNGGLSAVDRGKMIGKGSSIKKIYQKGKIPIFFREQVPLVTKKGKVLILSNKSDSEVQFLPTALGKWFYANLASSAQSI